MTEGYYEEPMKWTWKTNNGVYENDQGHESDVESGKRSKSRFINLDCPRTSNTVILAAFISYAIMSMICLIFLIQASSASSNDMSNVRSLLSIIQRNISSSTRPPISSSVSATVSSKESVTTSKPETNTDLCDNEYNEKCFRLVKWTSNLTRIEAQKECRRIKGKLGNVYDYTHFSQIASLIRSSMALQWQEVNAWTGMTVDIQTSTMYLSNLRPAAKGIPFYPGKQYSQKYRFLTLRVRNSMNIYARGMSDSWKTDRFKTALCEIEKTED